jgi:hypothetical protein
LFTVYCRYKNKARATAERSIKMETKKEIRNYCKNKLNALVRDHNHYNKVRYTDAVKDYRTAIEVLIDYAKRNGIKLGYTMDENGYITVA